jgi:hypothetical protein
VKVPFLSAIITPEYVAAVTGADVSDTPRVELLIGEATSLVEEWLDRTFDDDMPAAVRQAIAILVAGALTDGNPGSEGDVKAEQIGDYRVEYAGIGTYSPGLDIRRVIYLLTPCRGGGPRAVRTDVPFDGKTPEYDAWPDALTATVVVNR